MQKNWMKGTMRAQGTQIGAGGLAVILIAMVAVVLGASYVLAGHSTTGSAAPTVVNETQQAGHTSITYGPGTCKVGTLVKQGIIAGYIAQNAGNVNTSAAVAYNISQVPATGFYAGPGGVTLNTGAPVYANTSEVCGGTYQIYLAGVAGQTNYYPFASAPFIAQYNASTYVTTQLQKMAQFAQLNFYNGTGATYTATPGSVAVTPGSLVSAGVPVSFTFNIKTGAGAYGGNAIYAYFTANSVSISNIQLQYANGTYLPATVGALTPLSYNAFTGSRTYGFKLPPQNIWNTQGPKYTLTVTPSASFAANTAVSVGLNDGPGELLNGQMIYPAWGLDPNLYTDLGEPMTMFGCMSEYNGISGCSGPIELRAH